MLQSLIIQGGFPLKSGCSACIYCPKLTQTALGLVDDRGSSVNPGQVAEQSLCQGYSSSAIISVGPAASLNLTNVSFLNIRYQPKALIESNCGDVFLERVSFADIMTARTGLKGAVIMFTANSSDLSTCGSFWYRNGSVELLNNGYEIAKDWLFSGFLRADKVTSVLISNLTLRLNHLPSSLLHFLNSDLITLENCLFDTNLVYLSAIFIETTAEMENLPAIQVVNCTFQTSFGYQSAAVLITSHRSVSLLNCTFRDVFSMTLGIVEIVNGYVSNAEGQLIQAEKSSLSLQMAANEVKLEDMSFDSCSGSSLLSLKNVGNVGICRFCSNKSGDISPTPVPISSYLSAPITYASLLPTLQPSPCSFLLLLDTTAITTLSTALFSLNLCRSPGVTIVGNSSVSILNVTFRSNVGNGLISAWLWNDLRIDDVRFENNTYGEELGSVGIELIGTRPCSVAITKAVFVNNTGFSATVLEAKSVYKLVISALYMRGNTAVAQCAGLLFLPESTQASALLVQDSHFITNSAKINGVITLFSPLSAPISDTSTVLLQVLNCSFERNYGVYGGSGISTIGGVHLGEESWLRNITSTGNRGDEGGSGLYAEFALGKLSIFDSVFASNQGKRGAAVYHRYTNVQGNRAAFSIYRCTFTENQGETVVAVEGLFEASLKTVAALFQRNRGSSVSISTCVWTDLGSVFLNNTASEGSAALLKASNAQLTGSEYTGNEAILKGGAVVVSSNSNFTCSNCTFRRNRSSLVGGAVYVDQNSSFTGANVSCLQNYAAQMGACLYAHRSKVTLATGVLADNSAGMYGAIYISAAVLSVTSLDITGNKAVGRSPGIVSSLSTLTIANSYCHDQVGAAGGCAFLTDQSYGPVVNSLARNATAGSGGAFVVIALSDMTLRDSVFTDCSATTDGGFISLRISTLRTYGVTVRNIKSTLNYGSVFLLQSTLISANTSFSDLSGSAVYGFSTSMTISNTSFSRIVTQAGSGVNCAECPVLNISQSVFQDNLAKKGGALNSFTSGTAVTVLVSNLFGNLFIRNRAVNGGAVYFDGISVTMTDNVFRDNSASSEYYSALEMLQKGTGGAVYSVCMTLPYCRFYYQSNNFTNNSAESSGGGLYWSSSFPTLRDNLMEGNIAKYGNDVASFPVSLAALSDNNTILEYIEAGVEPLVLRLTNIASGQVYKGKIRIALVDQYDNIVREDSASSARLMSPNESATSAAGNTEIVALLGVFEFSNFTLIGPPESTQTILITSKGVNLYQKTLTHDPTLYYQTVSLSLEFRACISGETLQNNQCYPCPENTFSLDPRDSCMTCPSEAFCLGTNVMIPRPGYWRPDPMINLFFECLNAAACLGSPDREKLTLTGECEVGYHGNLCSTCDQNYSSQGNGVCGKCPGLESNIVLMTCLGILVLCFFTLSVYISIRGATKPRSELAIYFKILLNYLQIVTVASTLNLNWPSFVLLFLRGQEVAGNAADQLLSTECFLKSVSTAESFFANLGVFVALPAVLIVLILIFWGLAAVLTQTDAIPSKLIASFILAIFILHTSITKVLFATFACRELLPGQFWLASDLSIRCWNNTHMKNILTLALPGIIVWILGLPTVCLIILIKTKKSLGDLGTKIKYSFLYKGYVSGLYFWEFCILYRKILVVCISVFLTTVSLLAQALTMLAVLLVSLYAQQYFHPFNSHSFNVLETRSLLASLLTLFGGLFFYTKAMSTFYTDLAIEVLLFAAILAADGLFAYTWLSFVGPSLINSIKQKLAAIAKRYRVNPVSTIKTVLEESSKISVIEEATPGIRPDTFEVPQNTSFIVPADGSMSDLELQRSIVDLVGRGDCILRAND